VIEAVKQGFITLKVNGEFIKRVPKVEYTDKLYASALFTSVEYTVTVLLEPVS
jgi:hypothetical protein